MTLKTRSTPPPLNEESQKVQPVQQARAITEERWSRINPEVDTKLDAFIASNQKLHEGYKELVYNNPDRAVRAFMLNKMNAHEASMKIVNRQAAQAKEWLGNQSEEVQQRISDRIAKISPLYQQKALVNEIAREKARIDFAPPRQSQGQGVAI